MPNTLEVDNLNTYFRSDYGSTQALENISFHIKQGEVPEDWQEHPHKLHQKDMDARWVKKNGRSHYGYKNHTPASAIRPASGTGSGAWWPRANGIPANYAPCRP